jgi:predicted dehydrogenase
VTDPADVWSSDVSAVAIATPADTHFAMTEAALTAGKDVLVEKPLALSGPDAERLSRHAEERGRVLMVGHTYLYNPAVRRLREYIEAGELGDIYYGYSQRLNLGQVRRVENVWWNLAPHDVSIFSFLFGDRPLSVQGTGASYLQEGIEDVVIATLHYPDGKLAHIHVSWLDPGKVRKVTVVGAKKMIVFDDMQADGPLSLFDKKAVREPDVNAYGEYNVRLHSGDVLIPSVPRQEPLRLECQHFVDCVRTRETPITNGRHAVGVVRVLEAVSDSMRNGGRPVAVEPT